MTTVKMLAEMVKAVRDAQRTYFRTRTPEALEQSKSLERVLDATVADILAAPNLFSGPAPEPGVSVDEDDGDTC